MFTLIDIPSNNLNLHRCNVLMNDANNLLVNTIVQFKNNWLNFWDAGLSVEQMQAQLDLLATTPAIDPAGVPTNALTAYFDKALRFITYATNEIDTAFSDSVTDTTGQYQKYLTPGWIYTIDGTGRMLVSAPCDFTQTES